MKIAVHNGSFHADEAFAVAIISLIHKNIEIIRTRDESVLNECSTRIDVGGKYNPDTNDFDHHQKEFKEYRENDIKYASAGLVWKNFGDTITKDKHITDYIDKKLIQYVDAIDNGYTPYNTKEHLYPYLISNALASFNPTWMETKNQDDMFKQAVEFAKTILTREIADGIAHVTANKIVTKLIEQNNNQPILILEENMPWHNPVFEHPEILYVVFQSSNKDWTVRAAPKEKGSFENKKPLPSSWAGLRDQELATQTGVKDAIFCHTQRFIAVAKTKDGALNLAKLALENQE